MFGKKEIQLELTFYSLRTLILLKIYPSIFNTFIQKIYSSKASPKLIFLYVFFKSTTFPNHTFKKIFALVNEYKSYR